MAENEGFEPSVPGKGYTPLAGERIRPLSQFSVYGDETGTRTQTPCGFTGFQDRLLSQFGHPTVYI
jgi:hypothetical protein